MTEEPFYGSVYRRRGPDTADPFAPGDPLEGYELGEPNPLALLGCGSCDNHEEKGRTLERAAFARLPQVLPLACPACSKGLLADFRRGMNGTIWVRTVGDSVPAAFARGLNPRGASIFPTHDELSGSPHIEIAECRACHVRSIIATGSRVAGAWRVRKNIFGAVIAPDTPTQPGGN